MGCHGPFSMHREKKKKYTKYKDVILIKLCTNEAEHYIDQGGEGECDLNYK